MAFLFQIVVDVFIEICSLKTKSIFIRENDMMENNILNLLNVLALIILGIGSLIQLLDTMGLFPPKLRNYLQLNRAKETIDVLKEYGINPDLYKRHNMAIGIPRDYSKNTVENDTRKKLEETKIGIDVSVGKIRKTELSYYIDLMGHTCEPECAVAYARLLSSYWATVIEDASIVQNLHIDFIVTPKSGSPILGYEFSKLVKLPLVLHEDEDRFDCAQNDMRKRFDCAEVPPKGSRALIVDDSTTGGRMVLDAVDDLRKYGYYVSECLVVFEPCQKDARQKLNQQGIQLLSICKTHED